MAGMENFRYDGKRVLVVGGATGMGAAAARSVTALGAEVVVMDRQGVDFAVSSFVEVDLQDRAQLDAALDKVGGPVDAVFSAAGMAAGPGVVKVNFIAHRHIVDRLVGEDVLRPGSAVCLISSAAGLGWMNHLPILLEFLATSDFDEAARWIEENEGTNTYTFSKQAINAYVARAAYPLMQQGIRINAICPGPTDTPLARANSWLGFGSDYREAVGTGPLTADQMGDTMAFLNSAAASGISGVNVLVDYGHLMASMGGSWEAGKPVIDFLMTDRSH
jgi:NAD(P)-dependent dehydrogenase (short-subunit alcohol dehydrogenase family)